MQTHWTESILPLLYEPLCSQGLPHTKLTKKKTRYVSYGITIMKSGKTRWCWGPADQDAFGLQRRHLYQRLRWLCRQTQHYLVKSMVMPQPSYYCESPSSRTKVVGCMQPVAPVTLKAWCHLLQKLTDTKRMQPTGEHEMLCVLWALCNGVALEPGGNKSQSEL